MAHKGALPEWQEVHGAVDEGAQNMGSLAPYIMLFGILAILVIAILLGF